MLFTARICPASLLASCRESSLGVEFVVLSNTDVCNFIKKLALAFACKNEWKLWNF